MAMMTQRELDVIDDNVLNGAVPLKDFLAIIEKRLQSVPEEYREQVLVRIGGNKPFIEMLYYAPVKERTHPRLVYSEGRNQA